MGNNMNKIIIVLLSLYVVSAFGTTYSVYGLNGKLYMHFDSDVLNQEVIHTKTKNIHQSFIITDKKYISSKNTLKNAVSTSKIVLSDWSNQVNTEKWIEVDKNEVISVCLPDTTAGAWVTSLTNQLESNKCIQVQIPHLAGSEKIEYFFKNSEYSYKVNLAIGMKYIDVSTQKHKLGYYGNEFRLKSNILFVNDSLANFNNKIYPDPERIVSRQGKYLVDKYLVTNCEMIQTLWDSIPLQNYSKDYNQMLVDTTWISRKRKAIHGGRCDANDTAANRVFLYRALIYANARSERDGLTPVYQFKKTNDDINASASYSKIFSDSSFTTMNTSYKLQNPEPVHVSINQNANGYRLPYYDEWMVLARAGDTTNAYIWGKSEETEKAEQYAWFKNNYEGRFQGSKPVGLLLPNAYGLYDMMGLVGELVLYPGKNVFEIMSNGLLAPSCIKGGSVSDSLQALNFGNHKEEYFGSNSMAGLRLVRRLSE